MSDVRVGLRVPAFDPEGEAAGDPEQVHDLGFREPAGFQELGVLRGQGDWFVADPGGHQAGASGGDLVPGVEEFLTLVWCQGLFRGQQTGWLPGLTYPRGGSFGEVPMSGDLGAGGLDRSETEDLAGDLV